MGSAGHGRLQLLYLTFQARITLSLAGVVLPVRAAVAGMLAEPAPEPCDLGLIGLIPPGAGGALPGAPPARGGALRGAPPILG